MTPANGLLAVLRRHFGSQGWWPVSPGAGKPATYDRRWTEAALTSDQKFEVLVGAVLTQNTSWTQVARVLEELRRASALRPDGLARLPMERLESLLRPTGFFRQKARRLREVSATLTAHGGLDVVLEGPLERARAALLAIRGVGPETADSILLYAGGHPVFVVDAYTRRIGCRVGLFETDDYDAVQEYWEGGRRDRRCVPLWREAHALLVALAKDYCRVRPRCSECPLTARCRRRIS